jgi:hypothetical protein
MEIERLTYYKAKKVPVPFVKDREMMRQLKQKDTFFTSNMFLSMHLIQNLLYWVILLSFPSKMVIGCEEGHDWVAHEAFGLFIAICLAFDANFAYHYVKRSQIEANLSSMVFVNKRQ